MSKYLSLESLQINKLALYSTGQVRVTEPDSVGIQSTLFPLLKASKQLWRKENILFVFHFPLRTPPPSVAAAQPSPGPLRPAGVVLPVPGGQQMPRQPLLPGPDRNRAGLRARQNPAPERGGEEG